MKKILWVGEFTELNTGYSNYGRELLTRLHKMGKFDIYEMACYCAPNDARIKNIPWKVIPVVPSNPEEHEVWKRSPVNQWGAAKLEEVLLKIKPDVVMSIRDAWMSNFIYSSPYRDKFYLIDMPTVDSICQQESWLADYTTADAILTYSEFGRDTLIKETGGRINFKGIASPAVDYNIFKPVKDKKEHKKKYGLQENIAVVGTVMRNQKRKLYPELMEAFKDYTIKYAAASKDVFLLLHTQAIDIGWDISRLIKESGLSHKVLLSYICTNCQYTFPAFFRDALSYCPRCKQLTVRTPGPGVGFTLEQLAGIYNVMDLYVQYSISEGFGIPLVEGASCGVPIMSTNYSAMESIVKNLNGIPINIKTWFRECESHMKRVYPDNADFVEKLHRYLKQPESVRLQRGYETYLLCRRFYDYDKVAALWASLIEESPYCEPKWSKPKRLVNPNYNVPEGLSNEQFVQWCAINIAKHVPINPYYFLQITRDLNYGQSTRQRMGVFHSEDSMLGNPKFEPFTRQNILKELKEIVDKYNFWEGQR